MKKNLFILFFFSFFIISLFASETMIWDTCTKEDFEKGKFENTILLPNGNVVIGNKLVTLKVKDSLIFCWKIVKDDVFIGTGIEGKIYKLDNKEVKLIANTKDTIVSDIEYYKNKLYISTIPSAQIYTLDLKNNKLKLFCKLDTNYIWKIKIIDNYIYAITGEKARLYRINLKDKNIEKLLEVPQKHFLSMEIDKKNKILYLGTSFQGIIYKYSILKKEVYALLNLGKTEIKDIKIYKNSLFIVVNTPKNYGSDRLIKNIVSNLKKQRQKGKYLNKSKFIASYMSSTIYKYNFKEGLQSIFSLKRNFINCISVFNKGIVVGTGIYGKIYFIKHENNNKNSLIFDLKQGQITTLIIKNDKILYIGGERGLIYKVEEPVLSESFYYSTILDTKSLSKLGKVYWEKQGKLYIQFRVGNTPKPDKFWTKWTHSFYKDKNDLSFIPHARYIQYRVGWKDKNGVLKSVKVLYKPQNRPPYIKYFKLGINTNNLRKLYEKSKYKNSLKLSWKADDPDKDTLIYRLYYKNIKTNYWRNILPTNSFYTSTSYKWDTSHLPDGYYIIKLEISDEIDNSNYHIYTYKTRPILIDNTPPFVSLKSSFDKKKNLIIKGIAQDSFSFISKILYRINNGKWILISPKDEIYDDKVEEFLINLSKIKLNSLIEIKVLDSKGNATYKFIQISKIH